MNWRSRQEILKAYHATSYKSFFLAWYHFLEFIRPRPPPYASGQREAPRGSMSHSRATTLASIGALLRKMWAVKQPVKRKVKWVIEICPREWQMQPVKQTFDSTWKSNWGLSREKIWVVKQPVKWKGKRVVEICSREWHKQPVKRAGWHLVKVTSYF